MSTVHKNSRWSTENVREVEGFVDEEMIEI